MCRAPELLAGSKTYNKSVDVYSFGMLFWEMQAGMIPFCGIDLSGID